MVRKRYTMVLENDTRSEIKQIKGKLMYPTEDLGKNRALNGVECPVITTVVQDPTKMAGTPVDPEATVGTPCINDCAKVAGYNARANLRVYSVIN